MPIRNSSFTKEKNYTIDEFQVVFDLSPSQMVQANRYKTLKMKSNKTQLEVEEYNNLHTLLQNHMISPELFNHFTDALTNMQKFIKDEVEGYIHDKRSEFQAEVDKFSYKGIYQTTTTYFKKNTVTYQGQTYICLKDNVLNVLPTITSSWALIAKKGDQGIQGENGLNFTFRGRYKPSDTYVRENVVEYGGSLYFAKTTSTGVVPTNTTNWDLVLSMGATPTLKTFTKEVVLNASVSNVDIGIPEFNATSDSLFVYVNATYKHQGSEWEINSNKTSINVLGGTWGSETTYVNFVVFKNMQQELLYTDGTMLEDNTVSNSKLMPDNKVGSLSQLTTENKESLVDAVNEINEKQNNIESERADNFYIEFGTVNLSNIMVFEFKNEDGYDEVQSVTTGIRYNTPYDTPIAIVTKEIYTDNKITGIQALCNTSGVAGMKVSVQAVCKNL